MSTPRRPAPRSRPAPMIATVSCGRAAIRRGYARSGTAAHAGSAHNAGEATRLPLHRFLLVCFSWREPDLNRRHHGFKPCALPTELPRRDGRQSSEQRDPVSCLEVADLGEATAPKLIVDTLERDVDRRPRAAGEGDRDR